MSNRRFLSLALTGVLAVGLILNLIPTRQSPPRFDRAMALLKEWAPSGWSSEALALADTTEGEARVLSILRVDQWSFRRYRKGSAVVDIYGAYWEPGVMSHRVLAGHTPDVCWPEAGWGRVSGGQISVQLGTREIILQKRQFELNRKVIGVCFVHLLPDGVVDYGGIEGPPWYAFIQDLFRLGVHQRSEQLFLRISGEMQPEELASMDLFRNLLEEFLGGSRGAEDRSSAP